MTLILLNALLPIFVGLLLGYVAGRRGFMDNLNVRNLIVLVMDIASFSEGVSMQLLRPPPQR